MTRALTGLGAAALLLLASGCKRPGLPAADPALEAALHRIAFAGCAEVREGPRCELRKGAALVVWIPEVEGAATELRGGDRVLTSSAVRVDGGIRHTLALEPAETTLAVRLSRRGASHTWRLELGPHQVHPLITRAEGLHRAGQSAGAEALLSGREAELSNDRAALLGLRARLALARGDVLEAERGLVESSSVARSSGMLLRTVSDMFARSYLLIWHLRRFEEARQVLDAAALIAEKSVPQAMVNVAYYRAVLAKQRADVREALRLSPEIDRAARRLGMDRIAWSHWQSSARVSIWIGEEAAAHAALRRAVERPPPGAGACDRADALINLGAAWLMARDPAAWPLDPRVPLEEAMTLFETGCERPVRAANAALNLAVAAAAYGDTARAKAHLARVRTLTATPTVEMVLWWDELGGRVAIAEKRFDAALKIYRKMRDRAEAAAAPEAAFRALAGEAQAAKGSGDTARAVAAYARAEEELDSLALRVPVSIGRDAYLADREASARELVSLLLELGRTEEALQAARRARRRVVFRLQMVRSIERLSPEARAGWDRSIAAYQEARAAVEAAAREDWKLTAEQLRAARDLREVKNSHLRSALEEAFSLIEEEKRLPELPRPAEFELLLTYFPVPGGWVGFALDREGVAAHRIGPLGETSEARASQLLAPFDAPLARAKRIRILSYGALRAIDLHALPWRGRPLIRSKQVSYALDLAARDRPQERGPALIVGDATEDLPFAAREAREVEQLLAGRGLEVELRIGAAATLKAVRAQLSSASVFHYAGHGAFDGTSGFESALRLADGPLSLGDVLALTGAPDQVVLSGCETGKSGEAGAESWGLAQAFVVGGASAVVATTRRVEDTLSRRFALAYHGATGDPWARFQAASAAISDHPDWANFRLITP